MTFPDFGHLKEFIEWLLCWRAQHFSFEKSPLICCNFKEYFLILPMRCWIIKNGRQIRHRWIEPSRQQDMHILWSLAHKGRLRTLSSSLESRKFNSQKIRQRNVRVGCIVSAPFMAYAYNISWRGLLALLILWGGNARARDWDKQVQTPTSFLY